MIILKIAVTQQRESFYTMEDDGKDGKDFIEEGFSSDAAFEVLLRDNLFVDYFNTFLSLPIFAKRIFYRFDAKLFQIEGPPGFHFYDYSQIELRSFVREQRTPLFLKTDICNEYKLCRLILSQLHGSTEDDLYSLDLDKEVGSALSMQRFKAFLHETSGENVVSFWIAAERYRCQTYPECLRFSIREIQDRFIRTGAWQEVQLSVKSKFNDSLKSLFDNSNGFSNASELLVPCQMAAFSSLISYWLPKYLSHRSRIHNHLTNKWKSTGATFNKTNLQLRIILDKMKPKLEPSESIIEKLSSTSAVTPNSVKFSTKSSSAAVEKESKEFSRAAGSDQERSKSIDRFHCSSTYDTIVLLDDDENDVESALTSKSRASTSPFTLPRLNSNSSLVSNTRLSSADLLSSRRLGSSDLLSNIELRRVLEKESEKISIPPAKGNQLLVMCDKFRDVSLSRALALTNQIKGNSILNVEATYAFPSGSCQSFMPNVNDDLEYLWAFLVADQLAGHPFSDYLRLINHEQAFADIRFWVTAQQFLPNMLQMDTLTRRRQAQALIHIYLVNESPRKTSLKTETKTKLIQLLRKDLGFNALNSACWEIAHALLPFWEDFLDLDENKFSECVNYKVTRSKLHSTKENLGTKLAIKKEIKRKSREKIPVKHMWNALNLAITMSAPRNAKPLLEGYEDVDESDNDQDEEQEGSLQNRKLRVLNLQAAKALEVYRKCNPYQSSMAHYCYQQNLLLSNMGSNNIARDRVTKIIKVVSPKQKETKPKLAKPKCFQEILHNSVQFDAFKRFLIKKDAALPIFFWQAVESMRTNTREAKQRQLRANGILKRFFGPSTNGGQALDCNAAIVVELPYMEKVTPAMLLSAQTCVARSIEEKWYIQYLATFPEEDQLEGITKLPHMSPMDHSQAQFATGMKQSSRELWRCFYRNVISFIRGIADHRIMHHFQKFLKQEHKIIVKKNKAAGEEDPQRIIIKNKLVNTGKLLNDLMFWVEVDRYKEFADAVTFCAKLGNYSKEDELIVKRKAKAIVNCFLDSQIPPKLQINIPSEMADSIQSHVRNGIIDRGLFHDAAFSVFSGLLHFWKKFCLYRILPKGKLPECPSTGKSSRSGQKELGFNSLKANQFRRVSMQPDDEHTKIMFSLQHGLRLLIVPLEKEENEEKDESPELTEVSSLHLARSTHA